MLESAPSLTTNCLRRNGASTGKLKTRLASLLAEAEGIVQQLSSAEVAALSTAESLPNLTRILHPAHSTTWSPHHDLFGHAPDPMFVSDRHGYIVAVNPAACELLDVSPEQLMGRAGVGLVVDHTEVAQLWEAANAAPSASAEVRVRRSDGEILWVQMVCLSGVVPDDNLLWLWHDVTKRHRTDESLREANIELEQRNQALSAVHAIGVQLNRTLHFDDIFTIIRRELAVKLLGAPGCIITQIDPVDYRLVVRFAQVEDERFDTASWPTGACSVLLAHAIHGGAAIVAPVDDVLSQFPAPLREQLRERLEPKSALCLPLIVNGMAIGAISLLHREVGAFDRVEPTLTAIVGRMAAAALTNAGLYAQMQAESEERARLAEGQANALRLLQARVQELTLLQQVSTALQNHASGTVAMLEQVADALASAWETRQNGAVHLQLDGYEVRVGNPPNRKWSAMHSFRCADGTQGKLSIVWPDEGQAPAGSGALKRGVLTVVGEMMRSYYDRRLAEAARATEEALLNRVLEALPVGVMVLDRTGQCVRANPAVAEVWGVDAPRGPVWEAIPGWWIADDQPVLAGAWPDQVAVRTGAPVLDREIEIECPDGTHKALRISAVPVDTGDRSPHGVIVVSQDVTGRLYQERQSAALASLADVMRSSLSVASLLEASAPVLMSLLPVTGVAVAVHVPGDGTVVSQTGGALAKCAGRAWPAQEHLIDDTTEPRVLRRDDPWGDEPWGDEAWWAGVDADLVAVTALRSDGMSLGWIAYALRRTPSLCFLRQLQSMSDALGASLQRVRLHEELAAQARRLTTVMDAANFGLIVLDRRRRVELANPEGVRKLARLAGVGVGDEVTELAGLSIEQVLKPVGALPQASEITADGENYTIAVLPMNTAVDEEGWLLVLRDVTDERKVQASILRQERLASVGQLAAGIAHDFNNIVAVILLYVQMLERYSGLTQEDLKRLGVIHEQAQQAAQLIRQILDFSRQSISNMQALDLNAILPQTALLWERTLPESIRIVVEAGSEPCQVWGDPTKLQQVLTNLAINARDAMPDGGQLTVTLQRQTLTESEIPVVGMTAGEWVQLSVRDTGCGIQPEHLPLLFDPFFTTKPVGEGTGLGLPQVYGIVTQHRGYLTVESEPGMGACFAIYLPAFAERVDASKVDAPERLPRGHETILLVEDNAPAAEATASILERLGYTVLRAGGGRDAMTQFQTHRGELDLVVSDLVMPGMGGLELFSRLHQEEPGLPLIIVTGYPLVDSGRELMAQGVAACLEKPTAISQLATAIRTVLDG